MPQFEYHQKPVPELLRELAARMEQERDIGFAALPEVAVVIHGTLGEVFYVDGVGAAGSIESLGVIRLGEQILTNALLGKE